MCDLVKATLRLGVALVQTAWIELTGEGWEYDSRTSMK